MRGRLEGALRHDLSAVRVHESPEAALIGARAFTRGTHVHFAPGQYRPDSPGGRALLGHELGHVVQQGAGRVRTTGRAGALPVNDDAVLEREADRIGAGVAHAPPAPHEAAGVAPAPAQPTTDAPTQMKWWKKALVGAGLIGGGALLAAGAATMMPALAIAGGVGLAATGIGYPANRWINRRQGVQTHPESSVEMESLLTPPERRKQPSSFADHQHAFHKLIHEGKHRDAIHYVARNFGMDPGDSAMPYTLDVGDFSDAHDHAHTKGGVSKKKNQGGVIVTVNRKYLQRQKGLDAAQQFARVVHTLKHEHTHVRQKSDRETRKAMNTEIMEFDAYSTEVLRDQDLPPLYPGDRTKKAKKARKYFQKAQETEAWKNLPPKMREEFTRRNQELDKHLAE